MKTKEQFIAIAEALLLNHELHCKKFDERMDIKFVVEPYPASQMFKLSCCFTYRYADVLVKAGTYDHEPVWREDIKRTQKLFYFNPNSLEDFVCEFQLLLSELELINIEAYDYIID